MVDLIRDDSKDDGDGEDDREPPFRYLGVSLHETVVYLSSREMKREGGRRTSVRTRDKMRSIATYILVRISSVGAVDNSSESSNDLGSVVEKDCESMVSPKYRTKIERELTLDDD